MCDLYQISSMKVLLLVSLVKVRGHSKDPEHSLEN